MFETTTNEEVLMLGQTTTVIPSRDMVVVRLGPSPGGFNAYINEAIKRILGAVDRTKEE